MEEDELLEKEMAENERRAQITRDELAEAEMRNRDESIFWAAWARALERRKKSVIKEGILVEEMLEKVEGMESRTEPERQIKVEKVFGAKSAKGRLTFEFELKARQKKSLEKRQKV